MLKDGTCVQDSSKIVTKIDRFFEIVPGDEYALQEACGLVGPISVGIDSASSTFQFYSEGKFVFNIYMKISLN